MPNPSQTAIAESNIAISVSGLSKRYRIYSRPQDRLLQGLWGVHKQLYREFRALDDVSFDVFRGETVGIIGLNGSGKSTLLQLIAGTLTPTEGQICINGRISALLELGAGFNPEFTGRENVYMSASILGLSRQDIQQRYDRIVAYADIGDFIDQPVKTYSSGMYVRLAFAVAISVDPEVLIVDEALSVGDMRFQAKCMVTLKQLQESGASILFVTHDIATVKALCQRAIYLKQGRILASGSASEVASHYIRDVQDANNSEMEASVPGSRNLATLSGVAMTSLPVTGNEQFLHFAKIANHCRSGTGDARVMLAEMLDDNGLPLVSAEFGQQVTIRVIVEAVRASTFSVNYKICDKNLIAVSGADFLMQNQALLTLQPGQQCEVTYQTKLPLTDGRYSLRISITHPINAHRQAVFFDIVETAHVFEVLPNANAKFWTQVYLPNTLDIKVL